jgi:glutathione S-transferase
MLSRCVRHALVPGSFGGNAARSATRAGSIGIGSGSRMYSASDPRADSIILYGFPMSQPVRSVMLLCKDAGIDYEFKEIDVFKGAHMKADYKSINPFGLVPAIGEPALGDQLLGETGAILTYLCESRQLSNWMPADPATRARVNTWLHWHHGNTRLSTKRLLHTFLFNRKDYETEIKKSEGEFKKVMVFLNKQLKALGPDQYLAGTADPTIADLLILTEIDQHLPEGFGLVDFSAYPETVAWMERLKSVLGSKYDDVYAPVPVAAKFWKDKRAKLNAAAQAK